MSHHTVAGRQNKQHLSVDLDIWVCSRPVRSELLTCLIILLTCFPPLPVLPSLSLDFTFQQWSCCWPGRVGQKIPSVAIVQLLQVTGLGCRQSRSLGIPWHLSPPTPFIFSIFPHFQDLSCSSHLHLLPLGPLFFSQTTSAFRESFSASPLLFMTSVSSLSK